MSALSEFIEGKLHDRYGSGQELQDNITASNGSWYHTGADEDSSAAYDLASIFGGSAMSGLGDMATGAGVLSKDLLNRYAEYVGDAGNGQPVVSNGLSDWLINNGQYLSNTGSEITGRHMKQGKSKDGSWQDKGLLDRLSSLDYWTDPYGIGADAAVMGGSLASQAPFMALVPGGLVGKVAGGLLGRLGTGALTKAATESGMGKYLAEMATGGVAKQAERVMRGPTVNAMGDWAIRTAPLTALTNAGGIYGDLKEQGYSDGEIAKNMYGMMAEEMPQDFLTGALSGLALSGKLGRVLGGKNAGRLRQFGQNFAINAPIEVASEYFDEANQQRLQNKYSNKPYGENILNLLPDEAAAGASAAGPAVIPGLVGGARNVITRGKSFNEAYGEYRKKKALQSMRQQIQNTNEELSEAVDNANADMMNIPTNIPTPQSPAENNIQPQANNTATGTVENAAAPFIGQRMDNGENGCVEAVTKIGAGINGFLKNELDNGVVGVPKLVEDAEKNGVEVVSFSPDNVAAGDVIVYGDNDHVVMADGNGGYVGNSTSQQKVVQGDDYNAMGDLKPTKIIKTGSGTSSTGNTATSSAGNSGGTYSGDYAIDYAINEAAQKYNVDPALLAALAKQESGFNQSAQSGAGAVGVMQLMPETAKGLGVDANDLQGNIEGGAKYIRQMLDMYDGDVEKALAAYNAGAGNLDSVNGDISKLSEETRNYVPAVMANYEGFKGNKTSDNTPQLKLDTSDIFGDMTDDDISDILTDFSIAAMEDEDLAFPGLDNLLERGTNKGYISKEETQNILDNGMEQFLSYLNTEINKPDAKLAEALAERAAGHKNKKTMVRIQNAISTGDTPVIKQVANKYRQQLEDIRSNIYYAGDNSTPTEINSKNVQPIKANASTPATPKTEQVNGPEIKQPDINHAQNKEPNQQGNNIPNGISPQQVSRVQEQQGAAMADIALQQAFAMGKIAQAKQERIRQAQAIQSVAEANNISLPKAIKPALEAGAVKAIQKAQEVIAPTLDEIKGDVKNENIESTESSKTKTTEGIYSEDKVQHSEPEQIEGPAKVNNPDIELGVHHNTKTHEEQPSAVIRKKLDWKRLKELAKKHNGWYSRYAKKYLFHTTEDRDGFVADVNREFFSKNDNVVDNQQASEATNKAEQAEQVEHEVESKNAKDKRTDSDENDYHGFLDDKKPGEIAEIKRVLQAKTDPFGGDNGYVTSKHIMETLARSNAKGEVKNNRCYINGERTKKAAYAYFEYLRKIGYGVNRNKGEDDTSKAVLAEGYKTESGRTLQEADSREFIINKDGEKNIIVFNEDISKSTNGEVKSVPVRLQVGFSRILDSGKETGMGLLHIKKHESQIIKNGFPNAEEYINYVLNNFEKIVKIERVPNRIGLIIDDKHHNIMPVDLELEQGSDGFYTVVTAVIKRKNTKIEGPVIYDRSASLSSATNNGVVQNGADSKNVGAVAQSAANKSTLPSFNLSVSQNGASGNVESGENVHNEQEYIGDGNTVNSQPKLTEDKAREEIEKTANDFLDGKIQGEEAVAQLEKIRKYFAGDDNPNKSFEMVKLCNNKISMVEEITAPFADEKYQAGNLRFADEYRRYHKLESAPQEELGTQKNRSLPVYNTPHESKHDGNYTDGSYTDKGGSMRGRVKDGIIEVWEKDKDISKKDWSISISIADIDKAVAEGGANSAYSLKQLAGKLYREEMKKWFENHTADDREYREDNWQRFADDWETNSATDRAVDSVQNVLNELYKIATGNKVESPWEAHQHKKEENKNGEERTESEGLAGGREDVQSGTNKAVKEGEDGASGVSGEVSGHGRRKGENDSDRVGSKDSEESGPDGVPARTELEETTGKGAGKRGSEQPAAMTAEKAESTTPGGNWEIKESASGKTSKAQRFKQNIEAIKLLKKLEEENYMPTHEEQAVLAAYNGWGGLKEAFVDGTKENTELKALLTPEEYNAAKATMNDAFYTSPDIVRAIWKGVSRLGFKGGRILDPSMGVGNFFGCMPRGMMAKSDLHGVEIDSLTSRLAQMLYPGAFVDNKGFQDAATPDNFFDLVISNIPFGQKKIDGYQIHNYFFANGIDKVRPGGLMVFITSQGSLIGGKDGNRMRSYLASKADMLGAFKLPTTAFDEAGTRVVTDIVIMRKRNEDNIQSPNAQDFLTVGKREEYSSYYGPAHTAPINEYFKEHPDNIIGKIAVEKNQYGDYAVTVKQKDGSDVAQDLERAMQSLPEGEYKARTREKAKSFDTVSASKQAAANDKTRDYEYYMSGSKVVQNQNRQAVEVAGKKKIAVLTSFINLKNDLKALITAQLDPKTTDKKLESLRGILNRDYDEFVSKHGYLNSPAVSGNFIQDPSAGMVMALEKVQTEGAGKKKKIVKAEKNDIFFTRTIKAVEEVNKADNPSDALLFSLANKNGVDLEYMAGLLKSTPEKVAASLKGQIYKNPLTGDYETSEEYLSGNVREKLAQAKTEAKKDKAYRENVEALEKVVPEDLVSDEILVNIGSPWVPVSDMQDFVNHLVGNDGQKDRETVKFLQNAGKWEISEYLNSPKYKANGIEFGKLLEDIFNNKSIAIYDKAYDGGKEKAVLNVEKTDAANLVADDIRREFTEWLWSDKEREKRLVRYYNDNFNNSVTREYNGAHLTFPGKNAAITLRPHQKNVVWRMLQRVNTLIAHCVGAGKTFEMQAAGMEMRRLGIAQKPMYCLPNNVVEQFAREFRQLYPNAKLLVLTNDDLPAVPKATKTVKTEDGRKKKVKNEALDKLPAEEKAKIIEKRAARLRTLARIKTEDWDGIIISHNMFERFPLTPETTAAFIQEQVDTLERTVKEAKGEHMSKRSISGMETRIANLKEKLKDILDTDLDDIGIPFEQLGIDQLFVDEADMFKNLYYTTSMDRVSGLAQSNANRSNDMFAKTQWLTRAMGGRGVVFATGTPISNTMAEMYTMLRYLDMQGLKEKKLDMFDNWIRTFAEVGSGMERKPTGDGFRKVNKVKRFINMADLNKMFRKVADVKTQEDLDLDIPKLKNDKPTIVKIKADESLLDYIKNVVPKRVANMKKGFKHEKGEDNMLALTNDLRKMSLNDDKINACADQIAKKYEETTDIKGAQLVFCDMGIPRAEKDNDSKTDSADLTGGESESENAAAYEKLIQALKDRGIPEKQIAFVQSAKNKTQMDAMFQKVDNGDIRILIGSTTKMGAGTNCQHHLVALHDLDAPWRPRDLEQRHGRILRQGNQNKEVEIFNYVVQDSFDANMWEKLKNKAAIIAQAMSNNTQLRAVEDADLVTLDYAEIEGAATGNPLIKEQLKLTNEVTKYAHGQTAFKKRQRDAQHVLDTVPAKVDILKAAQKKIKDDISKRVSTKGDAFKAVIDGKTNTERTKADAALQKVLGKFTSARPVSIGKIGGMEIKASYSAGVYSIDGQSSGKVTLQLVGNHAYVLQSNSIQGMENTLNKGPEKLLADNNAAIEKYEADIKEAKETMESEYPHAKELKEMQHRLDEINRKIENSLVDGGNSENGETKYSVVNDEENEAHTMTTEEFADEVRKTFPNAKDFQRNGNEITFTLPNGSKVTVSLVDHIVMTEEEKAKASGDYGREIDDRDYAEGSFEGVGKDAFIQLAKGNRVGTLFHEAYHFAKKVALNAKEKEFLSKRYKNEEAEAEAYRAWRVARDRTGMFGKIWRKIKDIAEDMSNILGIETEGHIFRGIESGGVYNNTDRGSSNTRDIKYMLTEEAKNNLFNVIAQKVDGDVRNWQKLGIDDKEIRARLNEDNSESREEILKRMRATYKEMKVAVAQGPEARRAIVTRVLRGKTLPAGKTYETQFNEYMEKAKELIDYAGKYYTAISRDKSRNGDFALELHAVADVERRRNEALEAGRREREGKGRTFSIVHHSDDNSTPSLVERIKRRFAGASKVDSNYRKMAKEMLENLTQTKISWGKLDKDTKILYKELQGVIRVAKPYDWATLMPKVGEIVAKRMGLPNNSTMHNYIADWIMTGAVGNNSSAAQMFQQAMKKNDYMSDRLLDVQNLFVEHSDKATHDFLQNVVSFEKPRPKDSWHDKLNQYYDDWIEELGPVKRMVEAIEKTREKPLPIGVNPYVWFRLLRGHYGKAITMVEGNSHMAVVALQQLYPNVSFGGFKTLSMILKEIGADGDKKRRQEFSEYCVAKHVLDIHEANNKIRDAQKKYQEQIAESEDENVIAGLKEQIEKLEADIMDTPISETRCREIISKGNKAFDKGQQDIVRYSNTLLALLYDGGVISDKRYQRTLDKWPNYVPMFRVFEENEAVEFGDSLKGQEGSTRQVIDPLESIVRNTFDFVKRAEKNKCKLMLANLARCSGVGEYIDVVEANSKPNLNDTITFYMNGKRRYLVTDPSVVRAVNGMDRDNSSVLLRILQVPVKIARACFVIINPSFAIRNLFRDAADATVYSKYGFTPKDIIGGFMHALRRDDVYYEWLTSGAAQSSALSVDRNYAQSTLDRMTMSRKEKAMSPKYLLDILQAAGEYSEYATRIGVYEKSVAGARKQGQTLNGAILTAALESRDMMDFARGGRKSRTLNKVSLFANAAIQGWDKFFRVFDPRDKKTFMRAAIRLGLTAVLPALIFSLACRGDDWWEELPDWMKENNWVFKLGDTIIRIPKGQDIGIRFCSNFVEKAVGKTSKLTLDSMFKPLKDQIPSITPFAIMPIMESMANYSFFTEGPVVPGYLSKLPEDKQYNTNTSSLAKFIGSHTGISPIKIDHVIYGYTGNVGRAPNELINWLSKDNKSMPNATDLPILNGVTYMPYKNPASVTKFYDEWDKAQKEHNLYKQTGKIREGYSERKYEKLKAANKEMLELAKKERAVVANQSISNSEQYDRQMNIQKRRMQLAEKAIK